MMQDKCSSCTFAQVWVQPGLQQDYPAAKMAEHQELFWLIILGWGGKMLIIQLRLIGEGV